MPEKIALDEHVKQNPRVDAAKLREAQELMAELRKHGLKAPGYRLVSPYESRTLQRHKTKRDRDSD